MPSKRTNKQTFTNVIRAVSCVILLVGGLSAAWVGLSKQSIRGENHTAGANPADTAATDLLQMGQSIKMALSRLMTKNGLCYPPNCPHGTTDDIFRIDFSLPTEPAYGDNPAFELFNPAGGRYQGPNPDRLAQLGDKRIFTIGNSYKDVGSNQADLAMIMTNSTKEVCERISRVANATDILSREQEIDLTPFPAIQEHPAHIDIPPMSCVRTKQGLFYVHLLYER